MASSIQIILSYFVYIYLQAASVQIVNYFSLGKIAVFPNVDETANLLFPIYILH